MAYIITNVNSSSKQLLVVEGEKILHTRQSIQKVKLLKLDISSFAMMPGKVWYAPSFFSMSSHSEKKQQFIHWQKKGVTSLVVSYEVPYHKYLANSIEKARHELINSSIDYIIGITTSIKRLTPSFIRDCRRKGIPFIMVHMDANTFETDIVWEWLRNEFFPNKVLIIPKWTGSFEHPRKRIKANAKWQWFAKKLDIPTTDPWEGGNLSTHQLKALGVFPKKGVLISGSDLDYNLISHHKNLSVDDQEDSLYHNHIPNIVVLRGKLMKVDETIYYRPGYGKEVTPLIPGRFAGLSYLERNDHATM